MAFARIGTALRTALSRGAGFMVARNLLRGFSVDAITAWAVKSFGSMPERELLALVDHGRQMRAAGEALTRLPPGAQLDLARVPVNPFLSPQILEGARVVSELILPWQIQGTGSAGEWYQRFRHLDIISVDELNQEIETWFQMTVTPEDYPRLGEFATTDIQVGSFIGVGLERGF